MSNLPENWTSANLLEVSTIVRGVTYSKKDAHNEPAEDLIPVLRATNITEHEIELEDLIYVPRKLVKEEQVIRAGDVLTATSSGSISVVGKAKQARTDIDASFGAFCAVLRSSDVIDPRYFGHFFGTQYYRSTVSSLARGVNINNLKREHFECIEIPLAPLNEQKRIAEKLDRLLERVDACRAHLDRIPLLLKRFRQSVLAAATSGRLTADWREGNLNLIKPTEIFLSAINPRAEFLQEDALENIRLPNFWSIIKFGDVVKNIRGGSTSVPQDESTNFPILRSSSVRACFVDLTDVRYVTEKESQNVLNYIAEGDLLFTRLSGSLDYVANCAMVRNVNGRRIQYPDRLFCAKLIPLINAAYCELVFAAPHIRKQITEKAKSSAGHQRVAIGDITSQPIPIPPPEEQAEIVRRVESLFAYGDRLEARYQAARAQVEKLTPALLAQAFRGELVPQDPNDEPASVLLERIRATRAATAKPQRRKRR